MLFYKLADQFLALLGNAGQRLGESPGISRVVSRDDDARHACEERAKDLPFLLLPAILGTPVLLIFNFFPREVIRRIYDKSINVEIRTVRDMFKKASLSLAEFSGLLEQTGFDTIKFYNMQEHVERSIRRIHRASLLTAPLNLIKARLGVARENVAAWCQRALFRRKIAIYGVFVAKKSPRLQRRQLDSIGADERPGLLL